MCPVSPQCSGDRLLARSVEIADAPVELLQRVLRGLSVAVGFRLQPASLSVADRYPGAKTMAVLDRLPGTARNAYVSVLLDKIEADAYPSPDMVKRVTRLLSSG